MKIIYTNSIDKLEELFQPYSNMFDIRMPKAVFKHVRNIQVLEVKDTLDTYVFNILVHCRNSERGKDLEEYFNSISLEYQIRYKLEDITVSREEDTLNLTFIFSESSKNNISLVMGTIQDYFDDNFPNTNMDTDFTIHCTTEKAGLEDKLLTLDLFKVLSYPDNILLDTIMIFMNDTDSSPAAISYNYTSITLLMGKMMNSVSKHSLIIEDSESLDTKKIAERYAKLNNDYYSIALENKLKSFMIEYSLENLAKTEVIPD